MVHYSPITEKIKAAIRERISSESIISAPEILAEYASDASKMNFTPELVVAAKSVHDIQALMELANIYRFPVTPRGGGSGLAGACLPSLGGVVLLTGGLNRIKTIDRKNFIMKVEPGVISQQVRQAADAAGLFYPPDPAGMDLSTIGGNAATDAGGPACVKYGTTRDYILGLEAVLANGQLITTGVQTRKGVVGYDLTNLLVGSEGTLGIITSLTLKLIPKPAATKGMMCVFNDMVSAMNCVAAIMGQGYLPSAIEFLDHKCLSLIGELLPFSLPQVKPSILIIEVDGPQSQIDEEMEAICAIATAEAAIELIKATSAEEREKIWAVRRQVSLRIHEYAKLYIPEDIVVPLTAIAELVEALPFYEKKYGIEVFAFGHAGDGNIHLNITTQDPGKEDLAREGTKALLALTLRLQGTISGEHGIGIAKAGYLSMELSENSIELQRNIKRLFDPNLVLNPGKIFPERSRSAMDVPANSRQSYPTSISKRVRNISPSATKEMALIAAGIGGCVSLGQGVPSFATPPHIVEAVTRALREDPSSGKYSLQTGMPALRRRIAEYLLLEKNIAMDPESEICVTVGGMEALLATVMTVVDEGDEVILPSPTYASYIEQILLAGGIPRYVPLTRTWGLDLEAISKAITPKTRAIMLCNPGNPTGTVFSDDETIALCKQAVAHNFVVIIDEAYDYMVYDGGMPLNPLSINEFRNNVISISSLSKKYALTGWRVGWVAAAQRWMEQIMKVHDATAICSPTPSQFAALAALDGDQQCVTAMRNELVKRKTLCCARLDKLTRYFSYVPPKGAFYVMAKYLFSTASSRDVATCLLKEARVITIPGGAFGKGGEGHLRISFGGELQVINEAFDRIEQWLNNRTLA